MGKIKIGIIGGAGYTAGEAIRILVNHPEAEIAYVHSTSNAGNPVCSVHRDLVGDCDLTFTDRLSWDIDAAILCVGHGAARRFLTENPVPEHVRIIDLSHDFRLRDNSVFGGREFVYGLTEMNAGKIASARNIANPGCFATCIQLALLPLAGAGLLKNDITVNAVTGSTGAGQKPTPTTHFSWRANNHSVYKEFAHQHLGEIGESLAAAVPAGLPVPPLAFVPARGDFARGIHASVTMRCPAPQEEVEAVFQDYYHDSPFTFLSAEPIDLKQVVNTNKCLLHIKKHGDMLLVTSVIDNLLKGASGQAVENLNLMFGLERSAGLRLKASAF
ncbi:MAG: N-acetyl-gamma-glutamyl-phosphate reductase [Rikenellaceae bacterium]|nr:N-acetyl-gamma-glutamyl-phosphate reductase [Rikenellaceae bacterium]